jgi:putative ABC transport system permease protein
MAAAVPGGQPRPGPQAGLTEPPYMRLAAALRRIWHRLTHREARGAAMDQRLQEEIRFHLDMAAETAERSGLDPVEARRKAALAFGGKERWREAARDEFRNRPLEALWFDLRYAGRTFSRSPGFTLAAVATLSIGIGSTTAVSSAVDGALLRKLPFASADRLLTLWQEDTKQPGGRVPMSPANFLDLRERARSFSSIAAAEPFSLSYDTPDGPEMIRNWNVSEGFFAALGVHPLLGRGLLPSDHVAGAERVAILSYEGWQRRFGGDQGVIGKRILLDRSPATVVGVLPPNAVFPDGREMWTPRTFGEEDRQMRDRTYLQVLGRLQPGVSLAQAEAELERIAKQLAGEYPRSNATVRLTALSLRDALVGKLRTPLLILFGAVSMVLCIACANVASLLLTRTTKRTHEFALRTALGAGRGRVVRQMLAESLLLGGLGIAGGFGVASVAVAAMRSKLPADLPQAAMLRLDWRALLTAVLAGLLATLLCGVIPALRAARLDPQAGLRFGARQSPGAGRQVFRAFVIATEVMLAVILLVGGGLLVRSFTKLLSTDRGYRADHVLAANVFIWQWNPTPEARSAFTRQMIDALRALPGVEAAGATSALPVPVRIGPTQGHFTIEDEPVGRESEAPGAFVTVVTPEVFAVLRTPLLAGRSFNDADDASHPQVVIINQALARRYFGARDPLGRRLVLRFSGPPVPREIVGVATDVRESGPETAPQPAVFVPHAQLPTGSLNLVLRTSGDPAALTPAVRAALAGLNRELPIATVGTLEDIVASALRTREFNLIVLVSFALTALVLSIVGVYGVIAHATAERRQEIGVRLALGAGGTSVLALVLRQGLTPVIAGLAAGLLASAGLSRVLQGMLFGVAPLDPVTFIVAATVMLLTALLACLSPAWQASRLDPLMALRA